jgi:cytochrome P450
MSDGSIDIKAEARAQAYATPLEALNPAQSELFTQDAMWATFERLRREDPVHFTPDSEYGPYWSITKYNDIMAVDTNHEAFSSADGIVLQSLESKAQNVGRPTRPSFISMDPPKHDAQRKAVSPAVAPHNLQLMAPVIRERAGAILDRLPIGETFDWVDLVSKELTAMTLATLFDFPMKDCRSLTYWSDMMTNPPGHGVCTSWEQKREEIGKCFDAFDLLWNERVNAETPQFDMISMLAHNPATRDMDVHEYHGNVTLLIIGGNDTTRNTISGSIYALNQNPGQYRKLRENPSLIPSMVSETIRWQTPLAHMARTATRDVELGGKTIKAGDRVAMWYVSGNRDDEVIASPDSYIIDRERPRQHLSFGFGVHRCVGNRLAELQLTIIWEEILKRFPTVEVVGEPTRTHSVFVKGYETLPVIIPTKN